MGVGTKLEKLIAEKKMNVNVLCKTIGISPSTIYSIIKRDNTKVDLDVLQRIADELGVTLDYFASGNNGIDTLGARIKKAREKNHLYQAQLADIIGVKSAGVISNWEKDLNKPDADKIVSLCEALDISLSYLLGYNGKDTITLTIEEQSHMKRYRALDESGKQTVDSVLDIQYERCCAPSDSEEKKLLDAIAATKAIRKKIG